jgi:hypothetical protein
LDAARVLEAVEAGVETKRVGKGFACGDAASALSDAGKDGRTGFLGERGAGTHAAVKCQERLGAEEGRGG